MPQILSPTPEHIQDLVDQLRVGQIVGLPTETVYGLAANAQSIEAVQKIFTAKGRPADHPLIVHIASPDSQSENNSFGDQDWLDRLAPWAREVPKCAVDLAKMFWPGPLTIILPRAKGVLDIVTGGQQTVGIRCPNHPQAQEVLHAFGGGLAIPSANRFGRISPTTAQHVKDEFQTISELLILDGGACEVGIESTIVDLTHWDSVGPVILRPGAITVEQIESCTQMKLGQQPGQAIRFSGGLSAHYAPKTSLILLDESSQSNEFNQLTGRVAWASWVTPGELHLDVNKLELTHYVFPKVPQEAAQKLYELLRTLDAQKFDFLVFPKLPQTNQWAGVRDRLARAAVGSGIDQ